MSGAAGLLKILREDVDRRTMKSPIEQATVISAVPLTIQLDYEKDLQLEFEKGDFLVNDELILGVDDRLIVAMLVKENQYVVLCRTRSGAGTYQQGKVFIGDPTKTKKLVLHNDVTGPASAGTAHTHVAQGSSVVEAE